ncbi:hypothetical protein [Phyllobacterium endophyticum]|uniref:hypothetical protein n=1 Tax=Phyllobacterium endophyticum TaxID=1149773 RepID=UPI001FEEEEBE|nr:hypothetical protein [Phyllobacterium endophyticum]
MARIDEPPPNYEDVVALLRPGDILSHCFPPFPNAPVPQPARKLKPRMIHGSETPKTMKRVNIADAAIIRRDRRS